MATEKAIRVSEFPTRTCGFVGQKFLNRQLPSSRARLCATETHMNIAERINSNAMLTLRQEPLGGLELFCRALREALNLDCLRSVEVRDALRLGSAAECVQCGFHLTGEELLELAMPASPIESISSSFGRLRLGYCARKDCDSFYYRLTFRCMPLLDWRRLLPRIDAIQQELAHEPINPINSVALPTSLLHRWFRWAPLFVTALGITLLVAGLWMAYHPAGTSNEPSGMRTDPVQEDGAPAQ